MEKTLKSFRAVLFDFDGTLVDSMPYWSQKMCNILDVCGIAVPSDLFTVITALGDAGTAKYFREELGVPLTESEMIKMMDDFALDKYKTVVEEKPYVRELLEYLKEKGIDAYVLTASPRRMFEPCLERIGLLSYFKDTWSCEDFGTTKSDTGIYAAAAERMGVGIKDYAFVDDNCGALETARRAGVCTVGVFDDFSAAWEDKTVAASDIYVKDFSEFFK